MIYAIAIAALGCAGFAAAWLLTRAALRLKKLELQRANEALRAARDELAVEKDKRAGEALSAAAVLRTMRYDLELCRNEIPELLASMAPADAARVAGDLLDRSLQRAIEAGAGSPGTLRAVPRGATAEGSNAHHH